MDTQIRKNAQPVLYFFPALPRVHPPFFFFFNIAPNARDYYEFLKDLKQPHSLRGTGNNVFQSFAREHRIFFPDVYIVLIGLAD